MAADVAPAAGPSRRLVAADAAPAGERRGVVASVHTKRETPGERGVPKHARGEIRVEPLGVAGDFSRWRAEKRKLDDPDTAVLVLTEETLAALRADGWPVGAGDLGENVLTRGIPYDALPPGTRLAVGGALLEVSKRCDPCRNLHVLPYVGADRVAALIKTLVGRRGWYARVLAPGLVRPGDAARILA